MTLRKKTVFNVHYSSKTVEWSTPQPLFDRLNAEFAFTLDAAATKENAKCARFYTKAENGLFQPWDDECVFVNPPYGHTVGKWVEKMATGNARVCVGLLAARTDTQWFHNYVVHCTEVRFLKGRLKFGGSFYPAPFPLMICVWHPGMDKDIQ